LIIIEIISSDIIMIIKKLKVRIYICQILIVLIFVYSPCKAQSIDSLPDNIQNIPNNFLAKIQKKYTGIEESLTKKTTKYLQRLQRQEKKLQRKAGDSNSNTGITVPDNIDSTYSAFIGRVSGKGKELGMVNLGQYNSFMDTLPDFN
jgi:predicted PurR-regulated permease PerM